MKKLALISGCMILAFSFISLRAFSQEDATCLKSKMGQAMMAEQGFAKVEKCHQSQDQRNDVPEHSNCRMQGLSQMGQMSGMMPTCHQMMRQMMGDMGHGKKREYNHPMSKGLGQLGDAELFISHAKKLELSDDQVDQLKNIKHDQRKWNIKKKADIDVARVELEELVDGQPVNFDKIKSKISQVADMEKEMRLARLTAIQKAHKVLTAEQLEKVKNFRKHPARRMKKGPRQMIKEVIIEEPAE